MKISKFLVGLTTVLLLTACGGKDPSEPTVEHTLTFHANWNYGETVEGEPAPTTLTVADGVVVAAEDIPTSSREGYIFKAWCTTEAAVQTFDWTKAITRDYDLYAAWIDASNLDEVTLVGTINGWDPTNDDYALETEDGIHYTIEHVLLKQNDIWKVVLNDSWDGQINGNNLDVTPDESYFTVLTEPATDNGNIKMLKNGYFDITVDLSTTKLSFELVEEFVDENPIVDYEVYLAGSFTTPNWGTDESTKFTGPAAASGTWVLADYEIPGGEFKLNVYAVRADGQKDNVIWVGASVVAEMPEGWSGTDNISAVAGTYTLSYAITDNGGAGVLTITGEAAGPVLSVITYNIALAGSFTSTEWQPDFDSYALAGPEDATTGIWEAAITIPADGEFKLNVFKVYEDWTMDTNAIWVGPEAIAEMPEGWSAGSNINCTAGSYIFSYEITDGEHPESGVLTVIAQGGGTVPTGPRIMEPVEGEDFSLGFYSTAKETYYYFAGTMDSFYGATTTVMEESAAVRVEEVDAEAQTYRIWFLDSTYAKKYICGVISGTHKNFTIDTTNAADATVWEYDAEYQTFFCTLSGVKYFMGTYGNNTKFSLCDEKYLTQGNYIAHLYW